MHSKPKQDFLKKFFLVAGIIIGAFILIGVISFWYFAKDLPSFEEISNRRITQSTKIYDRTGKVLLYEISNGQKRTKIPLSEIPEELKAGTISIEDANFYTEPGFSIKGTLRAFLTNLRRGRIVQGGSSITQQLARNAFLSTEQTITRKIKEIIIAIRLTRYYPKDQILELYLNEIPYGPTLYGVEAASEAYFSKPAKDLSPKESAVLAALPKAPSYYSPWGSHQEELLVRADLVLKRMFELGKITESEYKKALAEKISFSPQGDGMRAPHFVIAVQDYLTQKYGEDEVRVGGLKVITTLDWDLQQIGEKAVADGAKRNEELYKGKNSALVSEDPKTGQILVMVGSRDYFEKDAEGNFNVATQGLRQPGSALKPFVYMGAFEKGFTPETILFDVPTNFDTTGNPEKKYTPENFDEIFRGPVNIRHSLAQSINIPAVKSLYLVGLSNTLKTLSNFGITTLNDPRRYGLSLVLGGGEVKLIEMVEAYSVLAANGIKRPQVLVLEVKDQTGKVLESFKDQPEEVINSQYPRLVTDILSDVDARAPLYSASLGLTQVPGHDIALKTGTSNDYRDAWTFGYTPTLVTGVWAGNNDNKPMQKQGSSILAALPIWHNFMEQALSGKPSEGFVRPDPTLPQKPVLAGSYVVDGEIHDILYYVDKNNPTGPNPSNPDADPQFKNWEVGVLEWAGRNPGIASQNSSGSSVIETPQIEIKKPINGEFASLPINIQAKIKSGSTIKEIRVLINNSLVRTENQNLGTTYDLNWQLNPSNLSPQNSLEINVIDANDRTTKQNIIFYLQ
jgi:1A family penicillin-binding protein